MKKLSKWLALLLALAMVFCLVACSATTTNDDADDKGDENAEKIQGEWVYSADLSDVIGAMLAEQLGDEDIAPETELYMNLTLEFDDGEFKMVAEVDKNSMEDYMDDLIDNMVDYMYDMLEGQGLSKEEIEEKSQQEFGMSIEEYVTEVAEEALDAAYEEMSFEASGLYKLDEKTGYIYIGEDESELDSEEEAFEYTFKGQKLIISGIISDGEKMDTSDSEMFGVEFPWTFEKN